VTSCISTHSPPKFEKLVSNAHSKALRWIKACEEWEEKQSQKHRRLINYQISCLLYLSKRINTVKKKRFWKGSGALVLDAVSVGLHREPHAKVSPFNQEMRRRIWATIQNFDMQASFDHGLPSIIALLPINVKAPRNINDEDFDEDSDELPDSKPTTEYTYASYQHLSRQSLPLRLELCKVLTGPGGDMDYDDVIRYTSEISREIDSLPSWDASEGKTGEEVKTPLLAYTLLHIQLRAYIIPLHQSYLRLRKTNPKYQYSEMIYYSSVRDMILLNDALMKQGLRTLNFLREDSLTLAINLCSVTMLQPRGRSLFSPKLTSPKPRYSQSTSLLLRLDKHDHDQLPRHNEPNRQVPANARGPRPPLRKPRAVGLLDPLRRQGTPRRPPRREDTRGSESGSSRALRQHAPQDPGASG
jgi:hypothetical protein